MRNKFPWFVDPSDERLQELWQTATFSFDANVLLDLYRVDKGTTEDFFKIFEKLGDRVFLTNEAANQFFLRRRSIIESERKSFSDARHAVENWADRRSDFNDIKGKLSGDIGNIISAEIDEVYDGRDDFESQVDSIKEDLLERIDQLEERFVPGETIEALPQEDPILRRLFEIFEGKTGEELVEEEQKLMEEARERYEDERPPGYEDYEEEEELTWGDCEDYIIWKQLKKYAEREETDVVFVTGEEKPDWWDKDSDHNIVRPRHELLKEFGEATNESFWMLRTEDLMDEANQKLGLDVSDESVEQTSNLKVNRKPFEGGENYGERDGYKKEGRVNLKDTRRVRNLIEVIDEVISEVEWSVSNSKYEEAKDSLYHVWKLLNELKNIGVHNEDSDRVMNMIRRASVTTEKYIEDGRYDRAERIFMSITSEVKSVVNRFNNLINWKRLS